ncbi:hypothetical protein DPMN_061578, partial [Dreissena polymorpha]
PERTIEYDVFISYSSDDLSWVKDVLLCRLENAGYRVCIDYKDFTPGLPIADNILDSIYRSRKTLVLLSRNFLRSMWGQFELQQALHRAVSQRQEVLIVIKYDSSRVPMKLMGKTFLDWTDTSVQPHFWARLNVAIGSPGVYGTDLGVEKSEQGPPFEIQERTIEYDVFISYSSDDLSWVKDVLLYRLENAGYRVCIDFKDFTPGLPIADNIMDSIYRSRKSLVLMSRNFLRSMWGQFEMQQALHRNQF